MIYKKISAHRKVGSLYSFIGGLLLLVSLFALAQDLNKNSLPDLGEPVANTATVQPNIHADGAGFTYQDNSNGSLLSIHPQYNKQNGAAIGGSLATPMGHNAAAGILLMAGDDRNEWLINAGMDLNSSHRFIFSLGQLRQKLDFNFLSGSQKTQITQDNAALSYQYLFGQDWLNAAEMQAYISDTNSINLADATYYTDTASLYELWNDTRRIAGGRVSGAQARLVLTPSASTTVKLGLGAERLTYDYLTGDVRTNRATGSAELMQRLDNGFNFRASANTATSQSRYALGLGKSFNDGSQLGVDVTRIQGRDHTFNDNQIQLSYSQSFGGNTGYGNSLATSDHADAPNVPSLPNHPTSANTETSAATTNPWASSLVEQVSRRPSVLPSQVIAKVDATASPTRLIAVDKTALPANSSVATTTGILTVPIGTSVSAIAGITLKSAVFSNSGQFTLSGSTHLVINPNLISQPASGVTDTYVVTMNNTTGDGTTLATVTVTHGSSHITSVVISSGIITPSLSGLALSSASVAFGAAAPTITAPTSASSGAITYTSSNTAVFSVFGSTITIVGVGTATLTATQAANGNYASTTQTTSLTVTAASPSITGFALSSASVVFGSSAPTISVVSSNSVGAVAYTSSNPAVATIGSNRVIIVVGAGTTIFTATQAANGNYTVATKTQELTVVTLLSGYINSGGLTWAPITTTGNWSTASATCSASNALGITGWRQPTEPELLALYSSGNLSPVPSGWTLSITWSSRSAGTNFHGLDDLSNGTPWAMHNSNIGYISCVH